MFHLFIAFLTNQLAPVCVALNTTNTKHIVDSFPEIQPHELHLKAAFHLKPFIVCYFSLCTLHSAPLATLTPQ